MKSVLLSIKPKYVVKILNGEKTVEVRKKFPEEYKGWVYIYCTKKGIKNNRGVFLQYIDAPRLRKKLNEEQLRQTLNGKVVARFYCDKVEEIYIRYGEGFVCGNLRINEIEKKTCLNRYELYDYLRGSVGYAIHISQLEIFDKPIELSEFKQEWYDCGNNFHSKPLTKAPQAYMFIEVEE